jgi:hypothetical protein
MAQPTTQRVTLKDAGRPLVLVGPPRGVRGEIVVRNPGDEKVIIRQPLMRAIAAEGRGKQAKAAALRDTALALRRIVVRPGQERQVPIALALDATTPPGTYRAELDLDGELRKVILHVVEDLSFSLEPRDLVIPNRPGAKIDKRIVITNSGNVSLSVKTIGAIVLDEELVHCRALRGAITDVGRTMKNLDDFVVALGHRYHALYDKLVLKVQNDPTTVEPGETAVVDLTISLPDKLEVRARYFASAPIATDSLTFTIVPE